MAYAIQARRWLARALQGEIDDGLLTEAEAIELATRFMRGNQEACFDLAGTRQALRVSNVMSGAAASFTIDVSTWLGRGRHCGFQRLARLRQGRNANRRSWCARTFLPSCTTSSRSLRAAMSRCSVRSVTAA